MIYYIVVEREEGWRGVTVITSGAEMALEHNVIGPEHGAAGDGRTILKRSEIPKDR